MSSEADTMRMRRFYEINAKIHLADEHPLPGNCFGLAFFGIVIPVIWSGFAAWQVIAKGLHPTIDLAMSLGWITYGLVCLARAVVIHRRWSTNFKAAVNEVVGLEMACYQPGSTSNQEETE